MVRIRLRRVGARHQPSYRIVVSDRESPNAGRSLETIGHYNPRTKPAIIEMDEARVYHWMAKGAQPSDSVQRLMKACGAWDRWERAKGGADVAELVKEAQAAHVEADERTRRDDHMSRRPSKKVRAREEAAEKS
jgi:small subunit ribosomal protein S16